MQQMLTTMMHSNSATRWTTTTNSAATTTTNWNGKRATNVANRAQLMQESWMQKRLRR